jgi:hypothetical protein
MDQLSLLTEDKLLLYCSRLSISEEIKHNIEEILNNALDWNYIIDCSIKQGISPLFYWNLKKISNDKGVPSETMKVLEKIYYSNLARNMLRYDELSKVLSAFKTAGIDVIVLKGAFLAEQIYKNIGLRPMSDIDLLVKEKDLQKAEIELTKLMYSAPTKIFPTKLHEQFQTAFSNELQFVHITKKIRIDNHWNIQAPHAPYQVDINKFWNNAEPVKIAGIEVLTFAPEDLLLHLCLHLDRHINSSVPAKPLRDFCDIAEVTRYYEDTIHWNYLLQSSKHYEIEEPIFQGLSIAKKYFGALVPENIFNDLKPIKSSVGFGEIFKGAMKNNLDLKAKNQRSEINYFIRLKNIDGIWNKSCIIFGDVFPSKEYMIYRYHIKNEKQVYLYYLIRSATALQWGLAILWQLPNCIVRSAFGK